jgi:hypothetical protein
MCGLPISDLFPWRNSDFEANGVAMSPLLTQCPDCLGEVTEWEG